MKKYKKLHNFYIDEEEEFLIKDILPWHYIDQNIDKNGIDVDYAVQFLQDELNSILNSFVNGGFSYKGYIAYPFVKDVSKDSLHKIQRLKKIAVFLNNNGHDFAGSIKRLSNMTASKNFAEALSSLYRDFSHIKSKDAKSANKPECEELDLNSYKKSDLSYLKPLSELKEYAKTDLNKHLSGFYLHGSLATKDYVKGWSDVDILAVISKDTINNPNALLGLRDNLYYMRYFLYQIDPLQHHGSIIISEYDLNQYCQAYFPIPIFKYAKSFFKDDQISKFKVRDYSSEALKKLFWFVGYFRKLSIERRFNLGSYDSKVLLHGITLFPTLYLQAKGILVYKKYSFNAARKDFEKDVWNVIDDASSIRSNWKGFGAVPLLHSFSKINPLLWYRLNSGVIDLLKDLKRENKIDTKKMIKNIFELSEEAWGKIKENAKKKL